VQFGVLVIWWQKKTLMMLKSDPPCNRLLSSLQLSHLRACALPGFGFS